MFKLSGEVLYMILYDICLVNDFLMFIDNEMDYLLNNFVDIYM